MSKQKLKKIVKELKGASKMHASQAERIGGMIKKSPTLLKLSASCKAAAKRKRGETMRKKGDAGAPSEQDLIDSQ